MSDYCGTQTSLHGKLCSGGVLRQACKIIHLVLPKTAVVLFPYTRTKLNFKEVGITVLYNIPQNKWSDFCIKNMPEWEMEEEIGSAASFLLPRGSAAAWSIEQHYSGNSGLETRHSLVMRLLHMQVSVATVHVVPQSPLSLPDFEPVTEQWSEDS